MSDSVTYEIVKKVAVLSKSENGWRKEANLVKWNGGMVKLDIRDWDEDHSKMKKGITLSKGEVFSLFSALKNLDFSEIGEYSSKKRKKEAEIEVPADEIDEDNGDNLPFEEANESQVILREETADIISGEECEG